MANLGKWNLSAVGLTTVLSTGLNSLTSGSMSAASSTYANQTNLDIYVDLEVNLASFSPATSPAPYVSIYILESVDGSNFPAQSAADLRLTTTQLFCSVPIGSTATTAQRVAVRNLIIPPGAVQFLLDNQTGAALAASGSTVKILPYNFNLNG